jgi:ATPase family associated with various cellular activities (AAA)
MNANSIFEKYRPKTWNELIGQEAIVKRIETIRQRFDGLGGKAFWLTGASGTGKSTAARLIANEVAQCDFGMMELDASDLTADFLRDYDRRTVGRPLGGNGWAFIANEAHLLSKAQIGKLLTVIEPPGGLPSYVVWCFTTTNSGEEKLFADCDDAGPLLSPLHSTTACTTRLGQTICRTGAADCQGGRARRQTNRSLYPLSSEASPELSSGAAGNCVGRHARLTLNRSKHRMPPTISEVLRAKIGDDVYRVSREAGVDYPALVRFVRGQRGANIVTIERLCAYFNLALVEVKPKARGGNGNRTNKPGTKRTGKG